MTITEVKEIINTKMTEEERADFEKEVGMNVDSFLSLCEGNPFLTSILLRTCEKDED